MASEKKSNYDFFMEYVSENIAHVGERVRRAFYENRRKEQEKGINLHIDPTPHNEVKDEYK